MIEPTEQAIFKIADACNLKCSYCYYYTTAFDPGILQSKLMSLDVAREFFARLLQHSKKYSISSFGVLLHGGEPLLARVDYYKELFAIADEVVADNLEINWKLTSNGVLLNQSFVDLFKARDVSITVSLDGPQFVHDRYRIDHKNNGSFEAAVRGLELLAKNGYPPSILCTIDPRDDGAATYRFFRSLNIEWMNFMLPDFSYDTFPVPDLDGYNDACFAYMKGAFDAWLQEDNPSVSVTYFKDLIRVILGGSAELCTMQRSCPNFITVETDGTINHCDLMRLSGNSNYQTGVSVKQSIDAIDQHSIHVQMCEPDGLLCATCRSCGFLGACGGHCPGTRFAAKNGFNNVSIYCRFFKRFIPYVASQVEAAIN